MSSHCLPVRSLQLQYINGWITQWHPAYRFVSYHIISHSANQNDREDRQSEFLYLLWRFALGSVHHSLLAPAVECAARRSKSSASSPGRGEAQAAHSPSLGALQRVQIWQVQLLIGVEGEGGSGCGLGLAILPWPWPCRSWARRACMARYVSRATFAAMDSRTSGPAFCCCCCCCLEEEAEGADRGPWEGALLFDELEARRGFFLITARTSSKSSSSSTL